MEDKKCAWCVNSECNDMSYLYCVKFGEIVKRDAWCDAFEREPGSDDEKGE